MAAAQGDAAHAFGPHRIQPAEVFVESRLSLGFVNLKPVVPGARRLWCGRAGGVETLTCAPRRAGRRAGHVLFAPRRVVPRFAQLTAEEAADLWLLAQRCGPALEAHFHASALTLAIQDGSAAGQTVPHVHIHLLPRRAGDFERNDEVYDKARRGAACSAACSTEPPGLH
jgi:bis(5'-adenosyl)-triphosphatase